MTLSIIYNYMINIYRRVKKFVHNCHNVKIQDCSYKNVLFLLKDIRERISILSRILCDT